VNFLNIEDLVIREDRQRQYFDEEALLELQDSIIEKGLMHAPVVRPMPGGHFELIAGERRAKAIRELWELGRTFHFDGKEVILGQMPYVTLGELTELEAEEAQLDENLRRKDLTWQEHAAAVQRLAVLRRKQAAASGAPAPTTAEIAAEVHQSTREGFADGSTGYGADKVRKELVVAKYLDRPTVRAAKSVEEAFKVIKREEELAESERIGRSVGAVFSSADHTLLHGDCLEILPSLSGGFDVILTDPPYGMGADSFGDSGGRNLAGEQIHLYKDSAETVNEVVLPALELAAALAAPQAHAYVFCDIDGFHQLRAFFAALGWKPFRTPLIWVKPDGRIPLPEHGPRRVYELLLYAFKGNRPVRKVGSDVLPFAPDQNLNMAAQKPVALFQELLSRSCLPGNSVLDPFAGTGPVLPAAHSLKIRATAIELSPQSYGIAAQRLKELK
jgi:DNA modification methylase